VYGLYLFRLFFVSFAISAQSICTVPILFVDACLRIFRGGCVYIADCHIGSCYPRFTATKKEGLHYTGLPCLIFLAYMISQSDM